jgi:UTP--glucose-1-phosphate uridylyltransferase
LELVRNSTHRNIHYIRQHEQRGLGNAVQYARGFVDNEPFMLLLGDAFFVADTPVTKQMMDKYKMIGRPLIALEEVGEDKLSTYGIAKVKKVEEDFLIRDLVEKPGKKKAEELGLGEDGKYYAVIGWYLLNSDVFSYLTGIEEDSRGEVQLTDALRLQAKEEHIYGVVCKGKRYDIGTKAGYYEAFVHAGLRHPEIAKYAEEEILRLADDIRAKRGSK